MHGSLEATGQQRGVSLDILLGAESTTLGVRATNEFSLTVIRVDNSEAMDGICLLVIAVFNVNLYIVFFCFFCACDLFLCLGVNPMFIVGIMPAGILCIVSTRNTLHGSTVTTCMNACFSKCGCRQNVPLRHTHLCYQKQVYLWAWWY